MKDVRAPSAPWKVQARPTCFFEKEKPRIFSSYRPFLRLTYVWDSEL